MVDRKRVPCTAPAGMPSVRERSSSTATGPTDSVAMLSPPCIRRYPGALACSQLTAFAAWLIFTEVPDRWTWVGAAVIFGSTTYVARREARLKERQGVGKRQ